MTKEEKKLLLEYDVDVLSEYVNYPTVLGQVYARDLVNELFTLLKDEEEDIDMDKFHLDIKEIKETFPLPLIISNNDKSKEAYYAYLDEYMLGFHDLDLEINYQKISEGITEP